MNSGHREALGNRIQAAGETVKKEDVWEAGWGKIRNLPLPEQKVHTTVLMSSVISGPSESQIFGRNSQFLPFWPPFHFPFQ